MSFKSYVYSGVLREAAENSISVQMNIIKLSDRLKKINDNKIKATSEQISYLTKQLSDNMKQAWDNNWISKEEANNIQSVLDDSKKTITALDKEYIELNNLKEKFIKISQSESPNVSDQEIEKDMNTYSKLVSSLKKRDIINSKEENEYKAILSDFIHNNKHFQSAADKYLLDNDTLLLITDNIFKTFLNSGVNISKAELFINKQITNVQNIDTGLTLAIQPNTIWSLLPKDDITFKLYTFNSRATELKNYIDSENEYIVNKKTFAKIKLKNIQQLSRNASKETKFSKIASVIRKYVDSTKSRLKDNIPEEGKESLAIHPFYTLYVVSEENNRLFDIYGNKLNIPQFSVIVETIEPVKQTSDKSISLMDFTKPENNVKNITISENDFALLERNSRKLNTTNEKTMMSSIKQSLVGRAANFMKKIHMTPVEMWQRSIGNKSEFRSIIPWGDIVNKLAKVVSEPSKPSTEETSSNKIENQSEDTIFSR